MINLNTFKSLVVLFTMLCCFNTVSAQCPVTVSGEGSAITFCYDIADTPPVLSNPTVNGDAVVFSSSTDNCVTYQSELNFGGKVGFALNDCEALFPDSVFCPDGKGSASKACKSSETTTNCSYTNTYCWLDASQRPAPGYYVYNGIALNFTVASETCLSTTWSDSDNLSFPNNDGFENCADGTCPIAVYSCPGGGTEICYAQTEHMPSLGASISVMYDNNAAYSGSCTVGSVNTTTNCIKFSECALLSSPTNPSIIQLGDCEPLTIEACPEVICPATVSVNGANFTFCYAIGTVMNVEEVVSINNVEGTLVSSTDNCVTYQVNSKVAMSAPYSLNGCDSLTPQDVACADTSRTYATSSKCEKDIIINGTSQQGICTYYSVICWEHEVDVPEPGTYMISGAPLELTANTNALCLSVSWTDAEQEVLTFPLQLDNCTPVPSCDIAVSINGDLVTFCYPEGEYFVINKSTTINGLPASYQGSEGNCITYLVSTKGNALTTPITYGNCTLEPFEGECPDGEYHTKTCDGGICYQTVVYCWDDIANYPGTGTYMVNGVPYNFSKSKSGEGRCIEATFEVPAIDSPTIFTFEDCVEKCPISIDLGGASNVVTVCYPEGAEIPVIGDVLTLSYNGGVAGTKTCKVASFNKTTNCIELGACEGNISIANPITTVTIDDCDPIYVGDCPETVGFWNNSSYYIKFCYADNATFLVEETVTVNGQEATYVGNFSNDNCIVYQLSDPDAISAPYYLNECGPYTPFTANCPTSQVSTKSCSELKGQIFCSQTVKYCWDNLADMPSAGYYEVNGMLLSFQIYESKEEYCLFASFSIEEDQEVVEYPFASCPVAFDGPCPDTSTATSTPGTKHCESYNPDVNCVYSYGYTSYSLCWNDPADRPDAGLYDYYGCLLNFTASGDNCLRATRGGDYDCSERPDNAPIVPDGIGLDNCISPPFDGPCPDSDAHTKTCEDGKCFQTLTYCWDNFTDYPGADSYIVNGEYHDFIRPRDVEGYCIQTTFEVPAIDSPTEFIFENCQPNCPVTVGDNMNDTYNICFDTSEGLVDEGLSGSIVINGSPFDYTRSDAREGNCILVDMPSGAKEIVIGDCPGIIPAVLPIELIYFEAEYLEGTHHAEVTWITAMELNVNYYQLERSLDGRQFETVHVLRDIEDSNITMTYRHEDDLEGINGQTVYYRLKNVDHDGSFDYSEIIPLEVGGRAKKMINIFPNPVKSFANVVVPGGLGKVVVYDLLGRTILSTDTAEGDVLVKIDMSQLNAGNYFVRYIGEDSTYSDAQKITVVGQ